MNSEEEKEKAFLKKGLELGLPLDFCQTVYSFLLSAIITPDGFYQIFNKIYSKNIVFEYLETMVNQELLVIDEEDLEIGLDDTCFLNLNVLYDPSIKVMG